MIAIQVLTTLERGDRQRVIFSVKTKHFSDPVQHPAQIAKPSSLPEPPSEYLKLSNLLASASSTSLQFFLGSLRSHFQDFDFVVYAGQRPLDGLKLILAP